MASGLTVAERRGVLGSADMDRCLRDLELLLSQSFDADTALVTVRAASSLSRAFHLSVYDAVYLDLARRERVPLATLDEHLRVAAPKAGVELLR
jgi:predicted nucleic acid-binding protein